MLFMVIERFANNEMVPIYERVRTVWRVLLGRTGVLLGQAELRALFPVDAVVTISASLRSAP